MAIFNEFEALRDNSHHASHLDSLPMILHNSSTLEESNTMATLNIKSFPDDLYAALKEKSKISRRSVAQEVIYLLEEASKNPKPRSIMELRGLGKEQWKGIDASTLIRNERDQWD